MTLAIRNIRVAFGGFQALDGVTLSMAAGDLVGLIGPNGAGKSTLFSVVSGFIAPDSGEVRFGDAPLDGLSPSARARTGLLRTFQVPREFSHLSVRDNLRAAAPGQVGEGLVGLFFRPGEVARQERAVTEKADAIIAFLKLDRVADVPAGRLSGGQKKLLELGRALMVEPRTILLDEPFAGVNPVLIAEIVERIRELNARGIGFLVIEHDLQALTRLVPVLHVMDRGRILASGDPAAVLDDPGVRAAYLGGVA
ncbi:ABC transporter ATP-binding protein [Methylobacterium oryzihabitans]|uniref:ABC transporter ATP-binding protein n=1 Tax=Methylobacterium oryzihabitans TaxID=2499852 RepID=A0A3S2V4F2_9HYPH|nr:ABC transporter ATP-binding protein [Methylobacterium oryzihabitans]RVU15313.1 ABC transporter ATP-binding protein [Methylobacterium oryzihabitans]